MRIFLALSVVASAGLGLALTPSQDHGKPHGGGHEAAALFAKSCSNCHTAPDPAVRTDLAWLDQVNRTT